MKANDFCRADSRKNCQKTCNAYFFHPVMQKSDHTRPDTPCVAVCSTTFDEVCRGCGRTVAEVAQWVFLTPEEKEQVWIRISAQGYPQRQS
jgi:uncharacterized protein